MKKSLDAAAAVLLVLLPLYIACDDSSDTGAQRATVEDRSSSSTDTKEIVMGYIRLYSDEQGESHFEDSNLSFRSVDFAPPAPPLDIAALGFAEQCSILRANPGWRGDWHPAPFRQIHFYLAGEVEAEASDGEVRRIGPGSVVLVEDTVGRGHRSRVVGDAEVVIAIVKLSESDD